MHINHMTCVSTLYVDRSIAASNYLLRRLSEELDKARRYTHGGGGYRDLKGGGMEISRPGQEILEQNSILIHEGNIEARLTFSLPAQGKCTLLD